MERKKITSVLVTTYTPDLAWNLWEVPPNEKANIEGVPKPEAGRVSVEIEWPTAEEFDRCMERASTTAICFALTKKCARQIHNFTHQGEVVETGAELVAVRSLGARRCRELVINIGSHILEQSTLSEGEAKN